MLKLPNRFLAAIAGFAAIVAAGCASTQGVVSAGPGVYLISKTHKGFSGASGPVLAAALEEANQYCLARGKVMKVVKTSQKDMVPFKSDASAEVYFKALDPNDPELKSGDAQKPAADLKLEDKYATLTRLNELREKGALTKEEFEAEKKKVLESQK
jgi:Short C-terminal domain